jgi:hypothetical protein
MLTTGRLAYLLISFGALIGAAMMALTSYP